MSFRFRLQKVLQWRRRETEACERQLVRAREEAAAAEDRLRSAQQTFERLQEQWRREDAQPLDALVLRARSAATRMSFEAIETAEAEVRGAVGAMETRRQLLVEAHRREQTLERLRDRQLRRHQMEENAQELRRTADLPRRYGGFPIVPEETRSFPDGT